MRALLIDSSRDRRDRLMELLNTSGLDCIALDHAATTSQIASLSASCAYDVCFIDHRSLCHDGRRIIKAAHDLPIILLTSDDVSDDEGPDCDVASCCLSWVGLTPKVLSLAVRSVRRNVEMLRQARESERLFLMAQESAGIGTWHWDIESQSVVWSPNLYRIFGLPSSVSSKDLYRLWLEAIHPDDKDAAQASTLR